MLEGEQDQIDGIIQGHHEARHFEVCHGQRLARLDLRQEQRDHRSPGRHHVAVTRAAEDQASLPRDPGTRDHDLLAQCLGHAHGIDGISRLVRAQYHHPLHPVALRRLQHIVGSERVCPDRLDRVKLARRDLLQGGRVKHEVHPRQGLLEAVDAPDIPDVELEARIAVQMPHVVLLLFVAREDADLPNVAFQKTAKHRVAKTASAAGDEECTGFRHIEYPTAYRRPKSLRST